MMFFKHCYWENAHEWGVLGLPKGQSPESALKGYQRNAPVLVAQTKGEPGRFSGQIFAVCTLLSLSGKTIELRNPEIVTEEHTTTWPSCLVIDEYWHVDPIEYSSLSSDLAAQAMHHQGKFFRIKDDIAAKAWLESVKRTPATNLYRSQRTKEHLAARLSAKSA